MSQHRTVRLRALGPQSRSWIPRDRTVELHATAERSAREQRSRRIAEADRARGIAAGPLDDFGYARATVICTEREGPVITVIRVSRSPDRAIGSGSPWIAAALGLAIALGIVLPGCIVQRLTGPQLTGTCDGACAHYTQCKPGHSDADHQRCVRECPGVFSDRDSLMGYESLSCEDAVEYVDGSGAKTVARHR